MSNVRTTQIAKIKIAKKDLGMDDDTYRNMLELVTKKRSAADLDFHQRNAVLHHLETVCGWQPKPSKTKGRKAGQVKTMADKIRACWITLHQNGIVRDSSEKSLFSYVQRQTKTDKQRLEFLDKSEASTVIESLKRWGDRHGVQL